MVSCKHFQVMGVLMSKSPITTSQRVELNIASKASFSQGHPWESD